MGRLSFPDRALSSAEKSSKISSDSADIIWMPAKPSFKIFSNNAIRIMRTSLRSIPCPVSTCELAGF